MAPPLCCDAASDWRRGSGGSARFPCTAAHGWNVPPPPSFSLSNALFSSAVALWRETGASRSFPRLLLYVSQAWEERCDRTAVRAHRPCTPVAPSVPDGSEQLSCAPVSGSANLPADSLSQQESM